MPVVSLNAQSSYDRADLKASLNSLLQPWGGMANFIKPGDRVLLKPNLLTGARPTKECTTRPELIGAVAELVMDGGGRPFLGDSPAFGSAMGVARANGLLEVAENLGIPIVEFNSDRYRLDAPLTPELHHLRLSREALEADVILNLPKVKSHMQLTLTLGVKNLFGCVPGKMKAWWHMEAGKDVMKFARMLVQTAQVLAPQLTIIDGIIGHEGNGPSGGEPRFLGLLGASGDVFALDRVMVEALGIDPSLVPTIVAAETLGCCPDLEEIDVLGSSLQDLQIHDWRLPDQIMPIDFGLPRILRSTFKHLYIKFIQERIQSYTPSN